MLRHHGVKPILVFDGGFLPVKGDVEAKRAKYVTRILLIVTLILRVICKFSTDIFMRISFFL